MARFETSSRPRAALTPSRFLALLISLAALSAGVVLPACTQKPSNPPPAIVLGSPVFHFDYTKAISLTIDKADPETGDHWIARVERQQESPDEFHENDTWKVASYSENASLPDALANRTLILHVLDTLSTLHPVEFVPGSGGPADGGNGAVRASYGLNPPRYALRWEVWDSTAGQKRTFQVEIGGPVEGSSDTNRLAYGIFPPGSAIFKLDGAMLPMLEYIKTFSVLRRQILSPLGSDDVDELEIHHQGKTTFYAQRDGAVWANRKHHPYKKDVQGFLDRITHLRIESFIDDESAAAPLRLQIDGHPLAEIVLKGRGSPTTTIRFARQGTRALADVSTRPGAVFELYPAALSPLSP